MEFYCFIFRSRMIVKHVMMIIGYSLAIIHFKSSQMKVKPNSFIIIELVERARYSQSVK